MNAGGRTAIRGDNQAAVTNALGFSRRDFFSRVGDGLCGAALSYLLGGDLLGPERVYAMSGAISDLSPRPPHFNGQAKAVIQLFMTGGPSQVDLLDPKPSLQKYAGQLPREFLDTVESVGSAGGLLPSPYKFSKCGNSGIEISEIMPHLSEQADELAVIRSMWTTHFNHEPAVFFMHSGSALPGRPALGAWVIYGLGSENQNLPAYVALDDPKRQVLLGIQNWQSGWLPPVYQGTRLRSVGSPLVNLKPQEEYPTPISELSRSLLQQMDETHRSNRWGPPDLNARIASYELAARMQISATDALDLNQESEATREMYGLNNEATSSYGRRCLMARRLVERGVRMVQIYMNCNAGNNPWDHHSNLDKGLRRSCEETDQPVGALLKDLKQRGLLETTLVIWGGEFGRLPLSQGGDAPGRDHGATGFSIWMAGGGVKKGTVYGATDEFGYKAVENPVSVHDFHATMLHLLGLDHEKLVYNHHGLNEKLTGVEPAKVVKEIIA
ncbi:MAG: DUF1501 domain-containing protein [Terriglobia bacterium]